MMYLPILVNLIHVDPTVYVKYRLKVPDVLVNQVCWDHHQLANPNVLLALNVLYKPLALTANVLILALELVANTPNVKLSITILSVHVTMAILVIHSLVAMKNLRP